MRAPGRIRRKLAALLSRETGLTFLPENCWPTEGWERMSRSWMNDSFRWTARPEEKGHRCLDSYDTMTACVTRGITINRELSEVSARPLSGAGEGASNG